MLVSFVGELQKTSRQLPLTLNFYLDIKLVSLLLSLNLMGSGSGGSSGGKKESCCYCRENCSRNFNREPLVVAAATSTTGCRSISSSKGMTKIMADFKATFGGSSSNISRCIIIIIIGSYLILSLSLIISICLSIYITIYLSISISIYIHIYLSIYLSTFAFLRIYLIIYH